MSKNYKRLVQLADEVFAMREDPEQLNVDDKVLERLHRIHPATISEQGDENGPVAWLLVIPTTTELMEQFISEEINEKELYELTPLNAQYTTIYLCSALVLPEYQRKGIIRTLAEKAISDIRKDHPITALFTWPFTKEGELASDNISALTGLPLYKRTSQQ